MLHAMRYSSHIETLCHTECLRLVLYFCTQGCELRQYEVEGVEFTLLLAGHDQGKSVPKLKQEPVDLS